jgi:Fe-S cluster biogenesis protein NfuA
MTQTGAGCASVLAPSDLFIRTSSILLFVQGACSRDQRVVWEKVEAALSKIRPALQADGGDVQVVEVKGGTVKVRLIGACGGCPMATMTLKNAVEKVIKERVEQWRKLRESMNAGNKRIKGRHSVSPGSGGMKDFHLLTFLSYYRPTMPLY